MFRWLVFFVLICVYQIKCQSSGWMGSLSTTSNIGIFMAPSNEYIITKLCGKAGQVLDSIGNIIWTNGSINYINSSYFGGNGGGEWCLETSCIDTIHVEYQDYAGVKDTIGKLIVSGSNNHATWGTLSSSNANRFSCDAGYCISVLKVKTDTHNSDTFVTAVNVDCNKPTNSPTSTPSADPTMEPTTKPSLSPIMPTFYIEPQAPLKKVKNIFVIVFTIFGVALLLLLLCVVCLWLKLRNHQLKMTVQTIDTNASDNTNISSINTNSIKSVEGINDGITTKTGNISSAIKNPNINADVDELYDPVPTTTDGFMTAGNV